MTEQIKQMDRDALTRKLVRLQEQLEDYASNFTEEELEEITEEEILDNFSCNLEDEILEIFNDNKDAFYAKDSVQYKESYFYNYLFNKEV